MARAASLQRGATLPDTVIKAQVFIKTIFMLFMWINTVFTEVSVPLLGTNTTPTVPLRPAQVLRTSINTRYKFWQQNQVAMNKIQIMSFLTALKFYSFSYFSNEDN